ncbi:MAG: hypothetical protein VZR07_11240 [Ruminococcus sp.]|nr:hypothetical protein [Ruminococcus sp.]MEE3440512.1 hypothetical protein [Ruminococcus sp.]
MMIPVPPSAKPEGIPESLDTKYGKVAITAKNGPPSQLTRLNTLVMCLLVSSPDLTPGINFPDFSKFSCNC